MNGESLPNDFYRDPNSQSIFRQAKIINELLKVFCQWTNMDISQIQINTETLREIIIRIDQRKVYFHIYHCGMRPSEYKMNALLIYWILKLRPFWIPINESFSKNAAKKAVYINESFCVFLTLNLLSHYKPQTYNQISKNPIFINELLYSFRFRDLSKEAIFLIFDALRYS